MTVEPFLLTIAVLGVSIIGFSGVIVTLPRPTSDPSQAWRLNEAAGVKLISEYSFALVLLSLIPMIIVRIAGSEEASWRVSRIIAETFIIGGVIVQLFRIISYRHKSPPRSRLVLMVMLVPGVILTILPMYITIDGWYELVLLWIIWLLGLQFWFFIKNTLDRLHTEPHVQPIDAAALTTGEKSPDIVAVGGTGPPVAKRASSGGAENTMHLECSY